MNHMPQNSPNLVLTPISAGFPNPAADAADTPLDLNQLVVKHPAATFYMRVQGTSMEGAGIYDGDLIVIDKSLEARHGDIVVAHLEGEFTLKRLSKKGDLVQLLPENDQYPAITISEDSDFSIWGVVAAAVHLYKH